MLYKQYKIILKYYQANVLESTYNVQRIISNEKELEFIFGRNQQAEGVFQEFADTFIFIKEDRDYIIDKRNDYLARKDRGTYLQLEFHALNRDTITYDIEYVGKLKFEETVIENLYANCPFIVDTAFNRLNAIQEDVVSIDKDGVAYPYGISNNAVENAHQSINYNSNIFSGVSYPVSESIKLGRKEVPHTTHDYVYSDIESVIYPIENTDKIVAEESLMIRLVSTIETSVNYTVTFRAYIVYNNLAGDTASVDFYTTSGTGILGSLELGLTSDANIPLDSSKIVSLPDDPTSGTTVTIRCIVSLTENLTPSGGTVAGVFYFEDTAKGFYFNLPGNKTSKIIASPLREILDDYETIQGLTINTDALDGTIYDVNNMLLSTSRGIKGITSLTYQFSFQKWFNSSKDFQALSFSYIGDTIYILPILDAYDDSQTKELPEALSLEISENDKGFNLLTIGNSGGGSANFDYEDLDPMAQATYDLGLEIEQNKEFKNSIRVDGATINKAAIDYGKVTTDIAGRDDDKDLYFIERDINETDIQSQFTLVSGVDEDKFGNAINLPFSKSRQLYNWRNYNGHLFTGVSEFQLKSWDKNKELVYTDTERGINVIDTPETISGFDDVEISPIFGENLYTVELPQKSGLYQFIKENPNIVYRIPFKGEYYEGYIEKVGLNPLIREVITVELTEKYIPRTTILSDSNEVVYSDDNFVILEKGY